MPSVFLVSDTHFGHAGVCRFTRNDGVTKLRPWDDVAEMDEAMIQAWNDRVKPNDKVSHPEPYIELNSSTVAEWSKATACKAEQPRVRISPVLPN